ncbi:hypothetical protein VP01_1225g9 [Puccinia sorghi]|uniref:DUF7918 domain-containing protein n=1 Tax=Puccinia sorghi TaxID=27349 RepID=A0A0L6VPX2_9BASI|nr:hypothetical protein VP01_1225g9 [Puccinia sorghi]
MPTNIASGSTCTLHLVQPEAHPIPATEFRPQTVINPTTGAIQELVTIESQSASPFQITLHVPPNAYALLSNPISKNSPHPALPQNCQPPSSTSKSQAAASIPSLQSAPPSHLNSTQSEDYIYEIILDGLHVGEGQMPKSQSSRTILISCITSEDYSNVRQLQFAPVELVDPDDHVDATDPADRICDDENIIKALGTIRIDITRCQLMLRNRTIINHNEAAFRTTNQMKFSERSKKACLSTTAGLAPSTPSPGPPPSAESYDTSMDPNPFLQFIFTYKPRSILEFENIIPQTIQPVESPLPPENTSQANNDDGASVAKRKATSKDKAATNLYNALAIILDITGSETEAEEKKVKKLKSKRVKGEHKKSESTADNKPASPLTTKKEQKPSLKKRPMFMDLTGDDD